jgi:hypothetical protein
MAVITVRPTKFDVTVANAIAAHTGPHIEEVAGALTWGADEHFLCALAAGWWLMARNNGPKSRLASDHVLLTTLVASALPHLLKGIFNQGSLIDGRSADIGADPLFPATGSTRFLRGTPSTLVRWHRQPTFFPPGGATRYGVRTQPGVDANSPVGSLDQRCCGRDRRGSSDRANSQVHLGLWSRGASRRPDHVLARRCSLKLRFSPGRFERKRSHAPWAFKGSGELASLIRLRRLSDDQCPTSLTIATAFIPQSPIHRHALGPTSCLATMPVLVSPAAAIRGCLA